MTPGLSLGELAGVLTALGALLSGLLYWSTGQVKINAATNESRVQDMRDSLAEFRADADERMAELRGELDRQRADWHQQMVDLRNTLTQQATTIHRQEALLGDYSRHVGKLERIMVHAGLTIPEFETSVLRGNVG